MEIKCLKGAVTVFFKVNSIGPCLGLSNEALFIIIGQGAAFKVGGLKRLAYLPFSKIGFKMVRGQIFFGHPTLIGYSFAAP